MKYQPLVKLAFASISHARGMNLDEFIPPALLIIEEVLSSE